MARVGALFLMVQLGCLLGCAGAEGVERGEEGETADSIPIRVDPTVELVSIVYRFADVHPFNTQLLPSYIKDIEEHFGPYRDHPAIEVVRNLGSNHGISGSAPMALALYLTAPDMEGKAPLSPLPQDLDPRWTPESVSLFRDAFRAFAADTRFMEFYADHRDYYDRSVESIRSSLQGHTIIPWLQAYFGQEPAQYLIIAGMQIGNGNYGMTITLEDGSREFISIIGANSPSLFRKTPRFSNWWFIPTVVHEFAHSFVNPVVDSNADVLQDMAERLYPYHREELWPLGYRSWRTLCYEYLVRASVNRYLEQKGDQNGLNRRIQSDHDQGFPGITLVSEALEEYEANRETYPTLDSFMPRIASCFEEILRGLEG